jgi:hypothetical protein
MHTRITRAACAAAAAGALTAVSLLAGAGAAAVPGSAAAGQAGKVPAGFQPAAASFYSTASGVVLGGWVACPESPAGRGWRPPATAAQAVPGMRSGSQPPGPGRRYQEAGELSSLAGAWNGTRWR